MSTPVQTKPYWVAVALSGVVSILAILSVFFWRSHIAPGLAILARPMEKAEWTGPLMPVRLTEGHFHLPLAGRPELAQLIIDLQLAVERDSERSIIFLVPVAKKTQFREGIASFSTPVKEFGAHTEADGARDERVMAFFE